MNEKADEIGLKNTNFVTPHGLDDEKHYTTAYDLAVITDYALKNEKFKEIVKTKTKNISINGNVRTINNTNELLGNLNGVDGVKTGFTGNAMRCLVTSCTRNEDQIITVVLGADTKKDRTLDSKRLIEFYFLNYKKINLEEIIINHFNEWEKFNKNRIIVKKSTEKMNIKLDEIVKKEIILKNGTEKDINIDIRCTYNFEAPVKENSKVGYITVKNKDEIIEMIDILNDKYIKRKDIKEYIYEFFIYINQTINKIN